MIIGKILSGRYEILEKIGEGGMAVVFKARCRLLKRFVAVKILKPEFTKDEKFIESFRRESQSAASLSHPNIVNVYDVGLEGRNIYYIVMEYVEGYTLSELIEKERPLPIDKAINIAKQIASALSHAHANHIIHRDIKPHNILITREGRAKVTDFGIAKAVSSSTIVTGENVIGSVHYFSPEQARGGYIDEKSDIYSLGIVLYEMVTGKLPFEGDSAVSVAMKHISGEMVLPSNLNSKIPKPLEAIIMKSTNKIQIKRFKTAEEMYDELDKVFSPFLDYSKIYKDSEVTKATQILPVIRDSGKKSDVSMSKKKTKGKPALKPYFRKSFIIRMSAIFSAIILALLFSNFLLFTKDLFFVKEISVPEVLYFDTIEAEALLDDQGLKVEKSEEYSSDFLEGQVISQNPIAGMSVKEGSVIKLVVSKGERMIETPILVNKKLEDALFLIEKSSLSEGMVVREASELPIGIVIRQNPAAREKVPENSEVDLVVSDGIKIKTILMINVIEKSIEDAKSNIETAGLKIGKIDYVDNEEYEKDKVISQSIEAGKEVQENTPVDLLVSNGKDSIVPEEEVTDVEAEVHDVPLILQYDQAINDIFTIKIFKIQDGSIEMIYNAVHNKENSGKEDIIVNGSGKARIAIYFDDAMIAEKNLDFETGQFYD